MVAKISYSNSLYGVLAYNAEKLNREEAKILGANKIYLNRDNSLSIRSCMEGFLSRMPSQVETKNPVVHISLNPHPDDVLTDSQLSDIATEYLAKMGFGNQPYVIYKHEDIDRHHIHIATLCVDEEGKKISDSNNFYRSRKILKDIEQRYGLLPTNRQRQVEAHRNKAVDTERGDVKRQIASVLRSVAKDYHYLGLSEYKTLLSLHNIGIEEVKGEVRGNPYHGLIYHALDFSGCKVGNPFKSSLFGKTYGVEGILKKAERSKEEVKSKRLAVKTKSTILMVMNRSRSKAEFIEELKKRGVDVVLRYNNDGRLYGTTFIDHNTRCALNGSRLGKELSANALTDWFDNPRPIFSPAPRPQRPSDEPRQGEGQGETIRDPFEQFNHHEKDETLSIGGLFDMPVDGGIDDPEEEAFRKSMQRKKRKRKVKL